MVSNPITREGTYDGLAPSSVDPSHCGLFPDAARLFGVEGGVCLQELTPVAIVLSAAVALGIGLLGWWVTWRINRKLAKKDAALLLLLDREPLYRDDFFALWIIFQKDTDFKALATHLPVGVAHQVWNHDRDRSNLPTNQRKWLTVSNCLNYYEVIAISIKAHAIDETIVKNFLRPRLVDYIESLYPFIISVRKSRAGDLTTWLAVENLAKSWGANLRS